MEWFRSTKLFCKIKRISAKWFRSIVCTCIALLYCKPVICPESFLLLGLHIWCRKWGRKWGHIYAHGLIVEYSQSPVQSFTSCTVDGTFHLFILKALWFVSKMQCTCTKAFLPFKATVDTSFLQPSKIYVLWNACIGILQGLWNQVFLSFYRVQLSTVLFNFPIFQLPECTWQTRITRLCPNRARCAKNKSQNNWYCWDSLYL